MVLTKCKLFSYHLLDPNFKDARASSLNWKIVMPEEKVKKRNKEVFNCQVYSSNGKGK